MNDLVTALRSGRVLLMDGAMGTELQRRAQAARFDGFEQLNLTQPDLIQCVHRDYLDAGAEVLLTNTFQADPHAAEIWQAALRLARAVGPRFVLADVGPIAKLTDDDAAAIWRRCKGADGVLMETWSSIVALERIARVTNGMPLLASFTFQCDTGEWLTFENVRPEECAAAAQRCGAVAVGANCGKDLDMAAMLEIVRRYRAACDLSIFVRPNAGMPIQVGAEWRFPRSPEDLAAGLPALVAAGIGMIGGCCGTTPEHVRAFRRALSQTAALRER